MMPRLRPADITAAGVQCAGASRNPLGAVAACPCSSAAMTTGGNGAHTRKRLHVALRSRHWEVLVGLGGRRGVSGRTAAGTESQPGWVRSDWGLSEGRLGWCGN